MGKQGTLTSFFRPANSSKSDKKPSSANEKLSAPATKKRPRPASAPANLNSAKAESPDKDIGAAKGIKRHKNETSSPEKPEIRSAFTKSKSPDGDSEPVVENEVDDNSPSTKVAPSEDVENDSGEDSVNESSESEPEQPQRTQRRTVATSVKKTSPAMSSSRLTTERTWKDGEPVPYKFLADAFIKVEEISGRLEIQAILSELFRNIIAATPEDLVPAIYICINKLAPAHEGIELGIGETILLKALSQVTGRTVAALKAKYKQVGDLGDVASSSRTTQKTMFPPPPLTVRNVFSEFRTIASTAGKNTQGAKTGRIIKMLVASSKTEAKFIARALLGKLRIHLADKTVIASLAAAIVLEDEGVSTDFLLGNDGKKKSKFSAKEERIEERVKDAAVLLNSVYSQLPVWDEIVPKVLEFRAIDERLSEICKLMPGVPVAPMLAKPTKAISEVLERFAKDRFTCEYKYDGERAQIHRLTDGSMKIYSRNAENLTPKYPDLISQLPHALKEEFKSASFIIDGEAVAYDTEKKMILPFQELQSRKRKDVSTENVTVKVCVFAFDLLFFNGTSLIGETLRTRRERLKEGFSELEGQLLFAKGHDSRDPEQIMELLNASVKSGCEGLMVKALEGPNATYEPANRSQNWLKVKKDYLEGCGDSLDLVPIGGYLGRGKRAGTYGAFLLACYDPDNEEYQSVCKIGTGFSDAEFDSFANFYNDPEEERKSDKAKSYYRIPGLKALEPDVWFEPVQVWEVKCADLSVSPQHTAAVGLVDSEKGIALRFPRFLRIREDKKPEDATSSEQVAEMYMRQSSVANNE